MLDTDPKPLSLAHANAAAFGRTNPLSFTVHPNAIAYGNTATDRRLHRTLGRRTPHKRKRMERPACCCERLGG